MEPLTLSRFPLITYDKIRYADTDRQGHVNNAVFSTFLETGRVEVLYHRDRPLLSPEASFVIASLRLDFTREIHWPGQVDIGTGVRRIGKSSIVLYQGLFQDGVGVAQAETTIVQVGNRHKKSLPLSEEARMVLQSWLLT